MGLLDKLLEAPGKATAAAVETVVRLPSVPLDVAEKAIEGAERGMEKLTRPKP